MTKSNREANRGVLMIAIIALFGVASMLLVFATTKDGRVLVESEGAQRVGVDLKQDSDSSGKYIEFRGSASPTGDTVSFAAVGDFGQNSQTTDVLEGIREEKVDLTLALGDFAYAPKEVEWCNYVKSIVGVSHPFELIIGNHDTPGGVEGDINEYRKCLPHRYGAKDGDYGMQYSFDHKKLARFINIRPSLWIDGGYVTYNKGEATYNWVANQIDDARNKNIKWVVLSMHENCITPGAKDCSIGEDLINLALEKKVDLVLQAHEHGYYRSKALALSSKCPAIQNRKFNSNCVVGSNGNFNRGTVIAISGAGGRGNRDPKAINRANDGFFEAFNDPTFLQQNGQKGWVYGFLKIDISDNALRGEFINVNDPGRFSDKFEIIR